MYLTNISKYFIINYLKNSFRINHTIILIYNILMLKEKNNCLFHIFF